jgi:heavy metal sensor kinase
MMEGLSIRLRLALAHTLVFGVLLTALALGLYQATALRLHNQVDLEVESRTAEIRMKISVGHSTVTWLDDKQSVERAQALTAFAIYDSAGNYLEGSTLSSVYRIGLTERGRAALHSRAAVWERLGGRGEQHTRVLTIALTGSDGNSYLLRVGAPLEQTEFELTRLKTSIVTLVPLVLLIGGAAGWWLAGRALEPVADITRTAARLSAFNLAERLPLTGTRDELDQLRSQFNQMIGRLHGSFEQMSQFLSNVSHELRTPLAALRGRSEVALRSASTVEEFREILAGNIEMHVRLAKTVSDMLVLARGEAGQAVLEHRAENLTELVRDTVESMRALAEETGIALRFDGQESIIAEVDPTHTMRLIMNLLDNAIKYNRAEGRVTVTLQSEQDWARITVADTGHGIPPQDLPYVFERFYRASEGNSGAGGSGLGLGLARWVAAAHGGRIDVHSTVDQGSVFDVWLPLRRSAPALQGGSSAPGVHGLVSITESAAMAEASRKRRRTMLNNVVRTTYWLGLFSGAVALVWRALVAIGMSEQFIYGDRAVGYKGFLNGAILFLLIACATGSYIASQRE